ncbi:PAS domain S-box-containing protein/diguanylate cyclase (GGDEF) domain-containing protein [Marinobacter segnicrescens]|uniref:PAS domain S-box-containing protein/diguanylate cyclase (GGDEF) domain-containing protein n=1 Tax=Marinobacter segnicrescens TaxID=430453 RepID=A0A1I0FLC0_9GAMM|nr:bifunctional diguanylate cyclase/phosphodiesterase [Marinobacter segnicrescens]SET58869.1 PAS domain S-box-containing protein/diguanylate cyclase (GGDEF) domain-containing protein [Marinobacter segnicrescens]
MDDTPANHHNDDLTALLAEVAYQTSNGVVITDTQRRIRWVNRAFEQLTGFRLDEIRGHRTGEFLTGPDTDTNTENAIRQAVESGKGFDKDILAYRRNGTTLWLRAVCNPISPGTSGNGGFMAVLIDVTQRKELERRLKITSSVFERSQDAIIISDADNRIIDVNPAFTSITGYTREEAIGNNPNMLSSGHQGPEFYHSLWRALHEQNFWRGEIWNRRKNGEEYPEFLSITRVQLDEPGEHYYVASFSDITALKNHAEELERAAHYDDLTGLPNRQLMVTRLKREMDHSDLSQQPLAVCYLDLDGFKAINNQVGQGLGDRALVTIANRLRLAVRSDDTVARVGGDEFVLLLRNVDDERVYQRILNAVRQPLSVGPTTANITGSMGITVYPNDSSDGERLVRHADQALYSAKEKGRNNYHFFDPTLDENLQQRRQQITELARAIREDEFELHYQPQIQLRDSAVIGVEALVRWQHPDKGLLAPGQFLPYIEGSHLEERFGQWVLRHALAQQAEWSKAGLPLGMSINISAAHLLAPGFSRFLGRYLRDHPGLDPALITLEILESTALDDMQRASQVIHECRDLGVQIALDDFGTGFSSLSYFRSLPVDVIKIDKSFTLRMLEDDSDRAIVESVIYMAQRFNRTVLAEGVETDRHGEVLATLGCDQIQGFGVARPMPAEKTAQWVRQWQARNPLTVPAFVQGSQ